jgi:hypothetical protein
MKEKKLFIAVPFKGGTRKKALCGQNYPVIDNLNCIHNPQTTKIPLKRKKLTLHLRSCLKKTTNRIKP